MLSIDSKSLEEMNSKERRKMKRLKKNMNEILLLSGKDPTEDCEADMQSSSNIDNGSDMSMKISRKLQAIRQEVAPPPLVYFNLDFLRGGRLGSHHIATLAQRSVTSSVAKSKWLCIKSLRNIPQTIVIRIDTTLDCVEASKKDSFIEEFFGQKLFVRMKKEVANRKDFWQSMLNIPIPRHEQIRQILAQGADPLNSFMSQNLRSNLLISLEQMSHWRYPFPGSNIDDNDISSQSCIRATKSKYAAVQSNSPMFAIDCEMCVTHGNRSELTRITMVDEKCNVLIDTLVKPHMEIKDYVTKYSGITKRLLDPVQTRLEDVQRSLSNILPEDAIIVGHSLEYDLRALQLSHPYCIDVASILNLSGSDHQRSSLKALSSIFLGETIQDKKGHCSVEDAVATMRLVNLKLTRGYEFGNVSLGWNFDVWARENGMNNTGTRVGEKRAHDEGAGDSLAPPLKKYRSNSGEEKDSQRNCEECGEEKNVNCSVKECQCLTSTASVCVPCSAKDTERESDQQSDGFDWSAALGTSTIAGTMSIVDEVELGKNKSILCCANGKFCSMESTAKARFCDTRDFVSSSDLLHEVCGQILEHSLAMIEMDSDLLSQQEYGSTSSHIDNIVERLVSSASPKALVVLILSSPQESTCRISVKP